MLYVTLLFLSIAFFSPAVFAISLKEMVLTLDKNPELLAANEQLRSASLNIDYALTSFMPNTALQFRRDITAPDIDGATDFTNFSISINLFGFGQSVEQYRQAKAQVKGAQYQLSDTESALLLEAIRVYLNVIKYRNIYKLSLKNQKVLEHFFKVTSEEFAKGKVTISDVVLAESRLEDAKTQILEAKADVYTIHAEYRRIFGEDPRYMLDTPSKAPDIPGSLDEAIRLAKHTNQKLLAIAQQQRASEAGVAIAKSKVLPSVDVVANFSGQDLFVASQGFTLNTDSSVGLSVTIPLLSRGGASFLDIKNSQIAVKKLKYDRQSLQRSIEKTTISSWHNIRAAQSKIQTTIAAKDAAEIAFKGVYHELSLGFRTSFDLLTAEQLLFSRLVAIEEARYEYIVATYTLLYVLGLLDYESVVL